MASYDELLAQECSQYYADPLGFVLSMFEWGKPGTKLEAHNGPDKWQWEFLEKVGQEVRARKFDGHTAVQPIRLATSSGHGIGKSVCSAWLILWIMSTRPHAKGSVTANTIKQLQTKTWAGLQEWAKLCRTGHWFTINSELMYRKGFRESWFCAPQSSEKDNAESFAGQHAENSTSFYIFDEASAIDRKIYETAEGGLTDGEPMIFLWGNPTKSTGAFYEAAFGKMRHRWAPVIVDSRESKFTNKSEIAEWVTDYGEDSDFVRVRVRGLPPRAGDIQFISSDLVAEAQRREPLAFDDDPLVAGFDVARGGADNCYLWFRRGFDARSIAPLRISGEQARDTMLVATILADALGKTWDGRKIAMLFIDGTGIGGPLADRLKQLGHKNVVEVQFAGHNPDSTLKLANMRAYIWWRTRDWLTKGAIPKDPQLETDLTGPGYKHDKSDRLVLESKEDMKKRGLDSPDMGDALALTFAARVIAKPAEPLRQTVTYDLGASDSQWLGM